MAKLNPVKAKQDADKLEKAGKLDQAISIYRQVVDDNPRDWNTVNKIGDLYAKLNKFREASLEYAKVADFYAKDGFLLKAIAIWKKINKLDSTALEPYLNLADLYAKQGLMMEAKSQYQIVVDEYIKRGKTRDAGEVLQKMAEVDPSDLKIQSKIVDLLIREGATGKAVEKLIVIAESLHNKGHLAEALQVLERGLKIDAKSSRLRSELARIHLVQKNYEKAAEFLEDAVQQAPSDTKLLARLGEAYLGARKIEEAEAIFKRLIELDPQDQEARSQMARVYIQQERFDQAYDQFLPTVDQLLERREGDKAAGLLQQIVQAEPSHVKSLTKLVEIYRLLKKESAVIATYSQLTEAYINQGQWDQAAAVLEVLVSLEPQNEQHRNKLQFVRGKLGGARAAAPSPAPPVVAPRAAEAVEEVEFDLAAGAEEASGFAEVEVPSPAPAEPWGAPGGPAAAERPAIESTGPLSDEDKEFVEEHLAEGKVFRKYGLADKAADQFESVIARFPDNVDARQELRDVYKEKGQNAKAAEQCLALAEIFRLRGDAAAAGAQEQEAGRLMPGAAPPKAAARVPAAARPAPPPPVRAPEPEPILSIGEVEEELPLAQEEVGEEEITVPEAEEEIPLEVEEEREVAAEEPVESGGFDLDAEPTPPEPPSLDLTEEAPGEELPPLFVEEEPPAAGEELEEFPLGEPEPEAPPPPPPPRVAPPVPLRAAPPPEPVAPPPLKAAVPAPVPSGAPAELQKVLDEVDSYVSLGFVDDAKEALREVVARYPGHPAILAKVAELGLDQEVVEEAPTPGLGELGLEEAAPEPGPAVPSLEEASPLEALGELPLSEPGAPELELPEAAAPEPELPEPGLPEVPEPVPAAAMGGGFDLGADLDDLFAPQSAVEEPPAAETASELGDTGLAEIFKEFKKGVDKQLGKEDYDTRYNLGIAYKEMGLVDEAIAEFQLAAKDESRLLECSSMLGICFMDKGMPKLAVKWFEKGLAVEGRSDEEYQGLRYDLATAYEAAGEVDRAYGIFSELYGQDANFRDVASKVRELKAALG